MRTSLVCALALTATPILLNAAQAGDFTPAYSLPGGADEEDRLFVAQTGRFLVVAGDSAVAGRLYDSRTGR